MSAEAQPPEASEEEFLDQAFERAVSLLEEGSSPTADDLLAGREHLRAEVEALLRTAHQVTLVRPAALPRVSGFTLVSEIGHGAMGRVYLARQESLGGRHVAIKVLPTPIGLSSKARDRFRSEVRAIAALRHRHVVTVHEVIAGADVDAYAMEWVDGASLGQVIEHVKAKCSRDEKGAEPDIADVRKLLGATEHDIRDPYPVFICRIGIAIARALGAVHRAGFLHRDVKPSNILLRRDGTPLLSDFGLVRVVDDTQTQSTQFAGTLVYAPPEQLEGEPHGVDARSDVYALGVTLYQALSLHLPFDDRKERKRGATTPTGMLRLIESGRAAPLRTWNERLPRDLQTIVAKAMEPDRARRYASPDELADDLERMLNLQPIRARRAGVFTRTLKFLRRNRASAFGVGAGSVVSLVLGMIAVVQLFLAPRWAEAHVREARLSLLDPAQANAVFNSIFWARPSTGSKTPPQALADAEQHYDAALRWRPFDTAIQAERDGVHRARSEQLGPPPDLDSRAAGLASYLSGDMDAALVHWEAFDRSRDLTSPPDPLIEAALGVLYLVREEPARAYPRLRAACAAFPNVGFLTCYLADAALQCGDVEYAERLLDAAAAMPRLDPFGALVRVRADLLAKQHRDTDAEELYRSAPNNLPALRNLARFLEARARTEEALVEYQQLASRISSRVVQDAYAASLERWWAGLSRAERIQQVSGVLQDNPDDPRSLVARLRVCAAHDGHRTPSAARPARESHVPLRSGRHEPAAISPLFAALQGRLSSPSLQKTSLAELANILEVDDMARWREIQGFPRVLERLQLCAWHSPWPHALSDAIHFVASSIRRHAADTRLRATLHSWATDPGRLARSAGFSASASPALRAVLFAVVSFASLGSAFGAQSGSSVDRNKEDPAWYADVSEDIRRSEYAYRPLSGEREVWSAPNRSHEFRSRISREGLEVFPRESGPEGLGARWKLKLSTRSLGRLGDARQLELVSITVDERRVELDRGPLQEWFENREAGLEQGFSITERPRGVEPLWIGLELAGDLSLRIDEGGRSGVLVDASGEVTLRYRDLLVFDARGYELAARLASSSTGIGIQIDDATAVYPLTVDPVLTGPAWTAESDQAGAIFGVSAQTAGDVNGDGFSDLIVGAQRYDNGETDEGRAFVYMGSALGLATSAAWTAESNQADAIFGSIVATAGDVNGDGYSDVLVGARQYTNGESSEGRAYLYLGSASGLATVAAWTAEGNQTAANFGYEVATAGDVNGDGFSDVLIGAANYTNGESGEGRAYLYLGSAAGVATTPSWMAESNQINAQVGYRAQSAGDVNGDGFSDVILGAPFYDNGQTDEGRVFLYLGSAGGLGPNGTPANADWTAESNQLSAFFGHYATTAGDLNGDSYSDVIVGAYGYDNGQTDEGSAFVYLGSASGLGSNGTPANADWTAESNQTGAKFGVTAATVGDVNGDGYSDVVVGAEEYDNGEIDEGAVFVYLGAASGLATVPAWTGESNQASAFFGYRAAAGTAGDVNGDGYSDLIVGAYSYDNSETDEGRVFVYSGSALGLRTSASWTAEPNQPNAYSAGCVATAGDVNGDGFSDVIVAAPAYDNGEIDEGRAYLYLGSASGLATSAAWTAESNQAGAVFGSTVSTAGDVNGDGYSDVILSAPLFDNGQTDEGRAYVYLGSASGLAASPAWTAESDQAGANLGSPVAWAGDVNGDGFSDVIISAATYDNGQIDEGVAFVYLGSPSGLATSAAWSAESDQVGAQFGYSVATAGDVNGDGFSDVIVGANLYDNGESNEGRAYLYLGSVAGLGTNAVWIADSDQVDAHLGVDVATAGDVNGDGFSDVIVGANVYDDGQTDEGRAFVYLGSASGLGVDGTPGNADWTVESDQADAWLGYSVAGAGDVNSDGYSDVIVGAYNYDNTFFSEGRAFLYLGSASGLATSAAWTADGNQSGGGGAMSPVLFGYSVETAGDVNGDGYSDVIVGMPGYDNGQVDEGRAAVFMGNDGRGGWLLAPQQRNASAPISLLGHSSAHARFRIRVGFGSELAGFSWASGSTPKARLEWQVARLGVSLDGSAIESGADQTIGGSPIVFDEAAGFDQPAGTPFALGIINHMVGAPYHWRARVRTNNPLLPVTPWISIPWNNVTETKLRAPLPSADTRVPH